VSTLAEATKTADNITPHAARDPGPMVTPRRYTASRVFKRPAPPLLLQVPRVRSRSPP
jgi:hypothetical protein